LSAPGKTTAFGEAHLKFLEIFLNLGGEQFEMHSIVTLANEIPWIMAPASLIAAMTIISGIVVVMRYTESIIKITMLWAVLNLTLAAIVMRIIF
jgi:hypothetical protein